MFVRSHPNLKEGLYQLAIRAISGEIRFLYNLTTGATSYLGKDSALTARKHLK